MIKTFKQIWSEARNEHRNFYFALTFSFIKSLINISEIIAIILTINALITNTDIKSTITKIIILTIVCVVGNFICSYIEQISNTSSGFLMVADERVSIASLLQKVNLGFFNQNTKTKIAASLTTTLEGVESASILIMVGVISGLFNTLGLLLFMLYYDFRIGLVVAIAVFCYLLVVNYQMNLSRKNAPKQEKAQNELASASLNFLQGIKVTKAFSFTNGDKKLNEAIKSSERENICLTKVSMPSQVMASLIIKIFESIILVLTIYFSFYLKDIDLTKTIVLLIFSFMAFSALNQAGSMLSMIGLLDSGLNEAKKISDTKTLETVEPTAVPTNNNIEFKDVSFSYGPNEILHKINLQIKENNLTAIIGPSGAGKTTLCELIPRFYDIASGEILIGGVNIKNMKYQDLMARISMVFQNVYLFEDTILNNIKFGKPDATLDEVRKACKKAHCDDFIMSLENGYDTLIKEGGNSLSGGEKQRISIARAILKDSPIIILDEATSALDNENESLIIDAIKELTKNKTVIMIAHRLTTVKHANQIVALRNGVIEQVGTDEELSKIDGLYKDFLKTKLEASSWKITNKE